MVDTVVIAEYLQPTIIIQQERGEQGIPGISAYQIALLNGFIGSELDWVNSLGAEVDTLQTVTNRGSVTTTDLQVNGSSIALAPTTTVKVWKKSVAPATIAINTATAIDTWATETYRSANYTIQVVQGTKFQTSSLVIIHDDTTVYRGEYGIVETNSGAPIPITYTASIATGTLTVNATLTDATTTNGVLLIERTLFSV